MSYTITKSDGTTLTTIADGTIDTTASSLNLPGPNYVGYGLQLNENLVHLLENFASNTAPAGNHLPGQLWYNKYTQQLNVFVNNTVGFSPVSGTILNNNQPVAGFVAGTIWFNTTTNQLYFYDGAQWDLIGPSYTKLQGVSGAIPVTVNDGVSIGVTHNILQMQFGNVVLATFSQDAAFTPQTPISGFSQIYPGLTINNTLFGGSQQFYSNANASAYIAVNSTVVGITSNVSALQNAVNIINANIGSYEIYANANLGATWSEVRSNVGNVISNIGNLTTHLNTLDANVGLLGPYATNYANVLNASMIANVTSANSAIIALQANVGSYENLTNANIGSLINSTNTSVNTINANLGVATVNINTINANIGAFQTFSNANVSGHAISINTNTNNINLINANIGAYQVYANANLGATWTGIRSNVGSLTSWVGNIDANLGVATLNINTINANIGAFETYANANLSATWSGFIANVGPTVAHLNALDANVGLGPYIMGNSQNWTSAVTTIGAALDQLAARLKASGH